MINRSVIQVPLPIDLKNEAMNMAESQGFSSLQEFIRVLLCQTLTNGLTLSISGGQEENIKLSTKAKKRYRKMEEDFKNRKGVIVAKNTADLYLKLNAN